MRFLLVLLCICVCPWLVAYEGKFLLLLGPSGTGKSTIIQALKNIDPRFEYITPFTTRELRAGETEKVHVSYEEMMELKREGKLLAINQIYGIYYATPKHLIDNALVSGKFPVLDWPVEKMELMESNYGSDLYSVYIVPEDLDELARRLALDNRDKDGARFRAAQIELAKFVGGVYDEHLDLKIVNSRNCSNETARYIYTMYMDSLMKKG